MYAKIKFSIEIFQIFNTAVERGHGRSQTANRIASFNIDLKTNHHYLSLNAIWLFGTEYFHWTHAALLLLLLLFLKWPWARYQLFLCSLV